MTSPPSKRGRPPFKPTQRQRDQVEQLRAIGASGERIAQALGITRPTLRKHFERELAKCRAVRQGEAVDLLFEAARHGKVGAMAKLLSLMDKSAT